MCDFILFLRNKIRATFALELFVAFSLSFSIKASIRKEGGGEMVYGIEVSASDGVQIKYKC